MADGHASTDGPRRIQTVDTTLELLAALKELEGATISELADHVDLSKGSIHTHLHTLRANGFVRKVDDAYRLGYKFITMGEYVRNRTKVYLAGKSEVDKLARESGEYAHLIVEDGSREIAVYEARGENAVATDYHTGLREEPQYLHDSSTGKAILAHLPERRVREIVDEQGLAASTENTITDVEALFEELERVRERGYAVNDEEEMRGIRAVGAPIRANDGTVLGAVSISAPTSRMTGERFHEETPALVMRTANVIEVNVETADLGLNTFS